jgi:formate hydrogenlyase subunit 4
MSDLLSGLLRGAVSAVLVLALAPFLEGMVRRITARVQSRQGPPLRQPYLDLLKLLGKEDIEAGPSPLMQRFSAYLSLAAVISLSFLVPWGGPSPLGAGADGIVLIYLLTLCGISTLLAGLAAGSVYSVMGMSREMMAMMSLEPLLGIAIIIGAVHGGSLRLDDILSGSVYRSAGFPVSGLLMLGVGVFSFQAFVGKVPFDISEAETEIMEGPLLEYSGPKLALFRWAQMSKVVVYAAIFVSLFCPWGTTGLYPLDVAITLAKVMAVVVAVGLVAASHARYRIDQAVRYYAILLGVSLAALGVSVLGY